MSQVSWEDNKLIAMAILGDRAMRRKVLGGAAVAMLAWMAVGIWVIHGWLMESMWRFIIYWALCAGLTFFVMIFALFDMLTAIREEREKFHKRDD